MFTAFKSYTHHVTPTAGLKASGILASLRLPGKMKNKIKKLR